MRRNTGRAEAAAALAAAGRGTEKAGATRDYSLSGVDASRMVPVSEARAQLSALIKRAADGDLFLMNHGRPAAVLMSPEHYQALLDELDDLQDRLAVWENADAPAVPFGHVLAELDDDEPHDVPDVIGGAGARVIG